MNGPGTLVLSVLMLAAIALSIGGTWLILKQKDRRKGWLMIVAGIVFFGNVLIWAWPACACGDVS